MVEKEHIVGFIAFVALIGVMLIVYIASKQQPVSYAIVPSASTYNSYAAGAASKTGKLSVDVSDPSFLPKGTTSFEVTFSNASVYEKGVGWISSGGFGPVNMMAQQNQSRTVSVLSLPYNSTITDARLGVGSAVITINGTAYNAIVPDHEIAVNTSGIKVGGNSTLLVDVSQFASPSESSSGAVNLGYTARGYAINSSASDYVGSLQDISLKFYRPVTQYANLTIENATLHSSADATSIMITVKDSSQASAVVTGVAIIGGEQLSYNTSDIDRIASSYVDSIVQKYISLNSSGKSNVQISQIFNLSSQGSTGNLYSNINSSFFNTAMGFGGGLSNIISSNFSSLFKLGGSLTTGSAGLSASAVNITNLKNSLYAAAQSGLYNASVSQSGIQSKVGTIAFAVGPTGALTSSSANGSGVVIAPGGSATLNYSGTIVIYNTTYVSLVSGSEYQIVLIGTNGTYATYSARAS